MFKDLGPNLEAVLDHLSAPADVRNVEISFETPDKVFRPAQRPINLFLYEIRENCTLRDPAPYVERVGDTGFQRVPQVRINCTYLTTTWLAKTDAQRAEGGSPTAVPGARLWWFDRLSLIEGDFLRGGLAYPPRPYPWLAMVAQLPDERSDGQFWSALGGAPWPAFSAMVTIAVQPFGMPRKCRWCNGFGWSRPPLSRGCCSARCLAPSWSRWAVFQPNNFALWKAWNAPLLKPGGWAGLVR